MTIQKMTTKMNLIDPIDNKQVKINHDYRDKKQK